ncbi:MAG: hypothetical protein RBR54_05030 [Sulfurimonas sp.]|jgi:septal ring factor EnvC (AmiA/AmiB activator)|nr:hypothetical protein [Sulfurimonas sp.]
MKKIATLVLAAALSSATLLADGGNNHKMGLVLALPHPMKAIIPNYDVYKFSKEQDEKMQAIIAQMPAKMHEMFDEAEALEREIQKAVMKEAQTKEQLKVKLDNLQTLKRKITELHIDTLNEIRALMSKKQYKMMMESLKELQQKKHQHKH